MQQLLLTFCLALSLHTAFAQENYLIQNIQGRKSTSLNGKWKIIIDPYETGYYDYRYMPSAWGFFKDAKATKADEFVEYNFDTSEELNVPGDWNHQMAKLEYYEGTIWYKKAFDYQTAQASNRVFLYFGAVNYDAKIYLNGTKIGEHIGGFTPFNIEVTGKLKDKGNFVVVKVDNKRYRDAVPTINTDWWNYGGITRDVLLVETPAIFVQDYLVQLQKGSRNKICGYIKLNGIPQGQKIQLSIPEAKINKTFTATTDSVPFCFDAKVQLWDAGKPKLYEVNIALGKEVLKDKIGFRTIETQGNKIVLNGKPVFLKGICIHEEIPMDRRRAHSPEDAKLLLGWAKELGCNYVRLAHYPHNEYMTRLADEMGLLVWSEIPVYWTINWDNAATLANAQKQLKDMISRDKNKASIILWSIGNETPVQANRNRFMQTMAETARKLDNTRLITAALEKHNGKTKNSRVIEDPLGEHLDVLGLNEYIGWYEGPLALTDSLNWEVKYNKPLLISELGAEALYGIHENPNAKHSWSEEFQETFYKHQFEMIKRIPNFTGVTPWLLADFRSPKRLLPKYQDGWNRKGLYSDKGEKKKAFYVVKDYYSKW